MPPSVLVLRLPQSRLPQDSRRAQLAWPPGLAGETETPSPSDPHIAVTISTIQ